MNTTPETSLADFLKLGRVIPTSTEITYMRTKTSVWAIALLTVPNGASFLGASEFPPDTAHEVMEKLAIDKAYQEVQKAEAYILRDKLYFLIKQNAELSVNQKDVEPTTEELFPFITETSAPTGNDSTISGK